MTSSNSSVIALGALLLMFVFALGFIMRMSDGPTPFTFAECVKDALMIGGLVVIVFVTVYAGSKFAELFI